MSPFGGTIILPIEKVLAGNIFRSNNKTVQRIYTRAGIKSRN